MKRKRTRCLMLGGVVVAGGLVAVVPRGPKAVSKIERYMWLQQPRAKYVRTSQYLTMRDGTRLAADMMRLMIDGQMVEEPLPVVWSYFRNHRADEVNGPLVTIIERWLWLVYYFRPDRSGSVESSNDGTLSLQPPDETCASIDFQVDYSMTSGTATRWTAERGGGYGYGDITQFSRLTFLNLKVRRSKAT